MAKPTQHPVPERVPEHVVLIPDGNGRWARRHGLPIAEGHRRGAKAVESFLRVCRDWDVPYATIWGFSTENWARSAGEVKSIMQLVEGALRRNRKSFRRDGIRLWHLGRRDRIRERYPRLYGLMMDLIEETKENRPYHLNLALDYGGRNEIVRAVRAAAALGTDLKSATWEQLEAHLDTRGQPDPDLIIRSSGEHRLSGIMPLQASYAEMVFLTRLLPELSEEDFREALRAFASRDRRFGRRPVSS